MRFNIWLGLSAELQAELVALIKYGEPAEEFPGLNQMSDATKAFFKNVYDAEGLELLFQQFVGPQRTYRLWSIYANKPEDAPQVRSDLDAIQGAYPQDFLKMGAWEYQTGREVSAEYNDQGEQITVGWMPIPAQIMRFMPPVMSDPGDLGTDPVTPPTFVPATDPTDVNLLFGQSPRDFSSYYV